MISFVDIHCHALYDVDDGAKSEQEMFRMLQMAYDDGTRKLCLTPHYDFDLVGDDASAGDAAFRSAEAYCRAYLPGMSLFRGNELSYSPTCLESLYAKRCQTVAGTRYVLVDFLMSADGESILKGAEMLLNGGYIPVIAHFERYTNVRDRVGYVKKLMANGAVIQVNADSLFLGKLSPVGYTARRLLLAGLIDVIASDGHDTEERPPLLSRAYRFVCDKCDAVYAEQLFTANPERILLGKPLT